jgi:hypothetical protein
MAKYVFTAQVTVSLYTEVHANSKEEALELAEQRGLQSLCHQCSSNGSDEQWSLTGELDGEPTDIRLDA